MLKELCVRTLPVLIIAIVTCWFHRTPWRLENNDLDMWIFVILIFSLFFVMKFITAPKDLRRGHDSCSERL